MRLPPLVAVLLPLLVACPPEETSGVDPNKRVIDMTAAELDQFCTYVANITAHQQDAVCDGTNVVGAMTKQECIDRAPTAASHPSCPTTVGQMEACFEASAQTDDVCHPTQEAQQACADAFHADCI